MTRLTRRISSYARILPRARRNHTDLVRWMVRRPQILAGMAAYETGLIAANKADARLKALAGLRTSSLIGCPF